MVKVELIHGDAAEYSGTVDLICTDPPYEMSGAVLAEILKNYHADHLLLLTTMKQLLDLMKSTEWQLAFDFVFDAVSSKNSKSRQQPNYVHKTGVYLKKPGTTSIFDRKLRQRSDVFTSGYWPTIFYAPKQNTESGFAKNQNAITDLLGSFKIKSVADPFAGSGTVGIAAWELELDYCLMVELSEDNVLEIKNKIKFCGI